MKRVYCILALTLLLPAASRAQVEKQVEVTKAYVPSVEAAAKLPIRPDMTDTVRMRPDIDYSVTPLALNTSLAPRTLRPATVTYWEFNRPKPFYLKAGAGWPFNTALDFYAATQHPGTGYAVGYLNHEGRFADIRNDFDVKNRSTRMVNRIGAAAGKYFGRHVLEADVRYENRLYSRYGGYAAPELASEMPGSRVNFGELEARIRLGDDFADLSRTNFNVEVGAAFFSDASDDIGFGGRARQTDFDVRAAVARGFGAHRLSAEADFTRRTGAKRIDAYYDNTLHAALRYGHAGDLLDLELGADYVLDKVYGSRSRNYVMPFVRLRFDLGGSFSPYAELDGEVRDNSLRTLSHSNPYLLLADPEGEPVTLDSRMCYNLRLGLDGRSGSRFAYRLWLGAALARHHVGWYVLEQEGSIETDPSSDGGYAGLCTIAAGFLPAQGRMQRYSFNGEIEYRPVGRLLLMAGLHGYLYRNDTGVSLGLPAFEGEARIGYTARRISFGVKAAIQGVRHWTVVHRTAAGEVTGVAARAVKPALDLGAYIDWRVGGMVSIFAEGRNLCNRRLYDLPYYPEYGANFTAGVKLVF